MSLAVFTDSTTAHAPPALTWPPTEGNSTKTTSVNSCWAWSVMPTVAISPCTRTHSWDLAYFKSEGTLELIIQSCLSAALCRVNWVCDKLASVRLARRLSSLGSRSQFQF